MHRGKGQPTRQERATLRREIAGMSMETRRRFVAEALTVFGEPTARALARDMKVSYDEATVGGRPAGEARSG